MGATAAARWARASGEDVGLAGAALHADLSGVLYWPRERLLCVADLHFEKASSFARRGRLLPPYDTRATLSRLREAIMRFDARIVICLGDNFHDGDGAARLSYEDRDELLALQRGRDWIWIAGNHDPDPAAGIGGRFYEHVDIGGIVFRHEPSARGGAGAAEIAGHLHPLARISARGRSLRCRCFVADGRRMVMPAFGAFTGGLNIRDRAFAPLFAGPDVVAHMLGRSRLHAVPAHRCLPD